MFAVFVNIKNYSFLFHLCLTAIAKFRATNFDVPGVCSPPGTSWGAAGRRAVTTDGARQTRPASVPCHCVTCWSFCDPWLSF